MRPEIKDFTLPELKKEMTALRQPAYRGEQVFRWIYGRRAGGFEEMTSLPLQFREELAAGYSFGKLEPEKIDFSSDGTVKILFRLPGRQFVETVAIPSRNLFTLCLSAQAGCRMGCAFCASGKAGFKRNLRAWEMAAQLVSAERITGRRATGVVFMGTGEPFDNYDSLLRALRLLCHPRGLNISARRITVSTAGITEKICEFSSFELPVNLSVSIHAPDDMTRSRLMPVNKKHPLPGLLKALSAFSGTRRKLTLEYALIKDVNDSPAMAGGLARIAKRLGCAVNVIPFNPVPGANFSAPGKNTVEEFIGVLRAKGARAFLRRSRGPDIGAACGQLAGRISRREQNRPGRALPHVKPPSGADKP